MIVRQRLWWTEGRDRLVEDGHRDARVLAYTPGDELADARAVELGLLATPKRAAKPADKARGRGADKAADGPGEV